MSSRVFTLLQSCFLSKKFFFKVLYTEHRAMVYTSQSSGITMPWGIYMAMPFWPCQLKLLVRFFSRNNGLNSKCQLVVYPCHSQHLVFCNHSLNLFLSRQTYYEGGCAPAWFHRKCSGLSKSAYAMVGESESPFCCVYCTQSVYKKEILELKEQINTLP